MDVLVKKTHPTDLLIYLYRLYQEKTFCDVVIHTYDGGAFHTHKVVLTASSEYLHNLFRNGPSLTNITLDIPSSVLQVLLQFSYTGQLFVTQQLHYALWEAARFLQMYTVMDLLKAKTEGRVDLDPSTAISTRVDGETQTDPEPERNYGWNVLSSANYSEVGLDLLQTQKGKAGRPPLKKESPQDQEPPSPPHVDDVVPEEEPEPAVKDEVNLVEAPADSDSDTIDDYMPDLDEFEEEEEKPSKKSKKSKSSVNDLDKRKTSKTSKKVKKDESGKMKRSKTGKRAKSKSDAKGAKKRKTAEPKRRNAKQGKETAKKTRQTRQTRQSKQAKADVPKPKRGRGKGVKRKVAKSVRSLPVRCPGRYACKCEECGVEFSAFVRRHCHIMKRHTDKHMAILASKFVLQKYRKHAYSSYIMRKSDQYTSCVICRKIFTKHTLYTLHFSKHHSDSFKKHTHMFKYMLDKCKNSRFLKPPRSSAITPPKKRGRPPGSVNKKPTKSKAEQTKPRVLLKLKVNHDLTEKKKKVSTTSTPNPAMKPSTEPERRRKTLSERLKKPLLSRSRKPLTDRVRKAREDRAKLPKKVRMARDTFECSLCSKQLISQYALFKHLRFMHQNSVEEARRRQYDLPRALKCEVTTCTYTTMNLGEMQEHCRSQHSFIQHNCAQCKAEFQVGLLLRRHMATSHDSIINRKRHQCGLCSKAYPKRQTLQKHQFWKHDIPHPSVKVYTCSFPGCDYKCSASSSIKVHQSKHRMDKPFKCEFCGKKLKTEVSHKKHINKIHLGIRPYLCQICGASFGEEHELKSHCMCRHSNERSFQCEYCPYATAVKGTFFTHLFNVHKVKAEDDKRVVYRCPQCPFISVLRHRYRTHLNGHMGKREYECKVCFKKFVCSATLRTHVQWLHSDKVFSCTQCDYQTKTSQKLSEHIRVQHQLKGFYPFRCPYCDFKCATAGNTRKHVKQVHKNCEVRYLRDDDMLEAAKIARASGHHSSLAHMIGPGPLSAPAPGGNNQVSQGSNQLGSQASQHSAVVVNQHTAAAGVNQLSQQHSQAAPPPPLIQAPQLVTTPQLSQVPQHAQVPQPQPQPQQQQHAQLAQQQHSQLSQHSQHSQHSHHGSNDVRGNVGVPPGADDSLLQIIC